MEQLHGVDIVFREVQNVVKVTIKDGKIEKVDSVVYTDDDKQAGSYEIKRDRILKMLEGLNSTKEIAKQLQNSTGEAYDAVSGATETAKGHVSADRKCT